MNTILAWVRRRIPQTAAALVLLTAAVYLLATTEIRLRSDERSPPVAVPVSGASNPMLAYDGLPDSDGFVEVAETGLLILRVDRATGHFAVEDKRNGQIWHSYPDPAHWEQETVSGVWRDHLRSPIMIQTLDMEAYNSRPKIVNWIADNGEIADFTTIEGGVRLTYVFTQSNIAVPVEIRIGHDYIETGILDEGIVEGDSALLWVRLFSFLGAEHSVGQEGYMLVPDGSGAIIPLAGSGRNENRIYKEPVYGADLSYYSAGSSRHTVRMPVFGLKTGNRGFVSVVEEGAEYADIVASPAGVYSDYNWIGTEMRYRLPFEQVTNRSKGTSITVYDEEKRFASARVVRYYLLDGEQSAYAGMAGRYRQYLMEEQGYERIAPSTRGIPLHLTIIGGERESGALVDRYIPMTTSSQAMEMVQRLYGMGVEEMNINLLGWQEDGFSTFGRALPVDARLGGDQGVGYFIDFARSLQFPVSYGVNYFLNNSGAGGFSERYHAMRDLMGRTLKLDDWSHASLPIVSHRFAQPALADDLKKLREIGFAGITFGQGYSYGGAVGSYLLSDYNSRYGSSRTESKDIQAGMFALAADQLDQVSATASSLFAGRHVDHIYAMPDDYSYDLFSQRAVPFMQIALHGLLTYSSRYVNEREQFDGQFLKDLEYGALPSFILSHAPTHELKNSYGLKMFSTQYDQWVEEAVRQYQIYNDAYKDVQDQFIVNHRALGDSVFETTFENGKRILVNYGLQPYRDGTAVVAGKHYLVVEGDGQ